MKKALMKKALTEEKLMDRRRKAGLTGRPVTWLRVTVAASSAALLGTLGLAGTSPKRGEHVKRSEHSESGRAHR